MKSHQEDAGRLINILSHQLKRKITLSSEKRCGLTNMQNRVLHFILRGIRLSISKGYREGI